MFNIGWCFSNITVQKDEEKEEKVFESFFEEHNFVKDLNRPLYGGGGPLEPCICQIDLFQQVH